MAKPKHISLFAWRTLSPASCTRLGKGGIDNPPAYFWFASFSAQKSFGSRLFTYRHLLLHSIPPYPSPESPCKFCASHLPTASRLLLVLGGGLGTFKFNLSSLLVCIFVWYEIHAYKVQYDNSSRQKPHHFIDTLYDSIRISAS